jgi:hypothetical protein
LTLGVFVRQTLSAQVLNMRLYASGGSHHGPRFQLDEARNGPGAACRRNWRILFLVARALTPHARSTAKSLNDDRRNDFESPVLCEIDIATVAVDETFGFPTIGEIMRHGQSADRTRRDLRRNADRNVVARLRE